MRAITYSHFGPARDVLVLGEIQSPVAKAGEVIVRLEYSGVNPSDVKARAGVRPGVTKPPFDLIVPHSDGSGTIIDTGPGVSRTRIGETVYLWNGQWQRPFGTAAEYIAISAEQAVPLPKGCSLVDGAVLGIPGMTAAHLVFGTGPVNGRSILVQGGGGTVGFLAVQLACWGGARVFATASQRDFGRIRNVGVEEVFDYADPDLVPRLLNANGGRGIDQVIEPEFGANIARDIEVVSENGRIAAYGSARNMTPELPFGPLMFKAVTVETVLVYLLTPKQRAATVKRLAEAFANRVLSLPIENIFPLEACADAHERAEAKHRHGAVLVHCQAAQNPPDTARNGSNAAKANTA